MDELHYTIKEKSKHSLCVLFETIIDKNGTLILPKDELDFGEMPICCMKFS